MSAIWAELVIGILDMIIHIFLAVTAICYWSEKFFRKALEDAIRDVTTEGGTNVE